VIDYYGAFLLDPDGNSVEAVWHGEMRGGMIDHLWLRVADVDGSARFYETIAPHAGLESRRLSRDHFQCVGATGSFSLVAGTPTENTHIAFPAGDDAAVQAFHRASTPTATTSRSSTTTADRAADRVRRREQVLGPAA
jgi:hypothetical protein